MKSFRRRHLAAALFRAAFLVVVLVFSHLTSAAAAADAPLLPPGWNAKEAADRVLAGLVNVSVPEVKGAHDAEMALVHGRP